MYVPDHFRESETSVLHSFIEEHNFGTVISSAETAPYATHVPFILDRSGGPFGTLEFHLARNNPQWKSLLPSNQSRAGDVGGEISAAPILVVFTGPHRYITPSWYVNPGSVPTWNYTAVHATGIPELVSDEGEVWNMLRRLMAPLEGGEKSTWDFETHGFLPHLMKNIVAFTMRIDILEGQFKLNQNKNPEDVRSVIEALRLQGDENCLAVAHLMQVYLDRRQS